VHNFELYEKNVRLRTPDKSKDAEMGRKGSKSAVGIFEEAHQICIKEFEEFNEDNKF